MKSSRQVAVEALLRVDRGGYSQLALDAALTKARLSARDAAFCSALFYGVLERRMTLDHCIAAYARHPLSDTVAEETYHFGQSVFNYSTNEIRTGNNKVLITSRQAEILRLLAKNLNLSVDRDLLLNTVWSSASSANSLALNVQITYVRKALRNDSSVKIESLMKKGYVLKDK